MKKSNLILHCGARSVTREQLEQVVTPEATDTWKPIPHILMVQEVEKALIGSSMTIQNEAYGLTEGGKRMFGLLQVGNGLENNDYSYVIGLRGSLDKSLARGLAVGSNVFVCDNLAFSSEIVFHRKQTLNILHDLPLMVQQAVGQLATRWNDQGRRIDAYKAAEISRKDAMVLTMEAAEAEVFPWSKGWDIFQEFKNPRHPEFKGNTVWSFFNAVTEYLKPRAESQASGLWTMPARTQRLHQLCDVAAGVVIDTKVENPS